MEKRIKALYIITIVAILAFLAMQVYWLFGRYESSLKDYERSLTNRIIGCVEEYNETRKTTHSPNREDQPGQNDNDYRITIPTFSLSQEYGDTVKTTRTAKIYTLNYSVRDVLGLPPDAPLTEEQISEALETARKNIDAVADSVVYDASGAKDENEAWAAAQNIYTQRKHPFSTEGLDSILLKEGITADIHLSVTDSMVWENRISYSGPVLRPEIFVSIPYSQFEGKTVDILCHINALDVLPDMSRTLLIAVLISLFLIVCLVLQFSTILKLSRLDRMRNSFTTTMIHELKRPISTLKMCVSGIENEKMMADNDTRREIVSESRRALDSLSAYFSRLRDITFNDVEQIPLNIQNVNVHKLFDDVAAAATMPGAKSVTLTNDIEKEITVAADRSHLFNILANLVENAIKYSGDNVEVRASATVNNDNVEISITDNGNGITAGDLKHIFKRFYRGRGSSADIPGMGLGLTYVRLLADAHGGSVAVESAEGKGSCFTIILPK